MCLSTFSAKEEKQSRWTPETLEGAAISTSRHLCTPQNKIQLLKGWFMWLVCRLLTLSEGVMLSSHKGSTRRDKHKQARSPFWAQGLYAHQLTGLPAWDTLQKARGTSKRMTLVTSARIMRWFKNWRENGYTFELIKYTGKKYLVGISLVGQGIWWFYSTSLQHPEAIWQNFQIQGWGHFNHWQVLCWKMEKQNTKPESESNYPLSRLS